MSAQKLTNSLKDFSLALYTLAEEVHNYIDADKEYKKNLGTSGTTINEIKALSVSIASIKDDTKIIIKNQEDIKKLMSKGKAGDDTDDTGGIFGKLGGKETISKIKDGASSIILIAGAVLAIGTAFKIVGVVDFLSVIALALSITILVTAFERMTTGGLTFGGTIKSGLILGIMSASIVGAGFLLKMMPTIETPQLLAFAAVAIVFSIMSFSMEKLVNSANKMKISSAIMLPLLLPAITLGIALSSYILSKVSVPSNEQLLAFAAGAIVFSIMSFSMEKLVNSANKMKISSAIMLPLLLPAITLGIALSSYILSKVSVPSNEQLLGFMKMGVSIGITMLAMSIPLVILSKVGTDMVKGALYSIIAFPVISLAVALSSLLIGIGNYDDTNRIPIGWAFSFAIAMSLFSLPVMIIGRIPIKVLLMGALGLIMISSSVATSARIFSYIAGDGVMEKIGKAFMLLTKALLSALPGLSKFLKEILPPLGEFLATIIKSVMPAIQGIIEVAKTFITSIKDILNGFAAIFTSFAGVIKSITGLFSALGDTFVSVLENVGSIIEKVSSGVVSIINAVTDSVLKMSQINGFNLISVGAGLAAIGGGLALLTGGQLIAGLGSLVGSLFKKDDSPSLFDQLINISKYGPDLEKAGTGVSQLSVGLGMLTGLSMKPETAATLGILLDKMAKINTGEVSAKIENVNKQVIDGTELKQSFKLQSDDKMDKMVTELTQIKSYLANISSTSFSISSTLDSMKSDKVSEVKLN